MVAQHEQVLSSSPALRAGSRNSLITAAAIRRGEIKISHPIPIPDAHEGGPAAAGVTASPVPSGAQLTDIRPPQPPQFNGLYDGRPPTRGRRVYTSAGNEGNGSKPDLRATQHPRGGKSVDVLPTQQPISKPRHQQKRSSIRVKRGSPTDKRVSSAMNQDSYRTSYDSSGEYDGKEETKDKKRGSGSLRGIFRKVFGGSKKEKDTGASRGLASRGQDINEHEEWMVSLTFRLRVFLHLTRSRLLTMTLSLARIRRAT